MTNFSVTTGSLLKTVVQWMVHWVIANLLARSCRPGRYEYGSGVTPRGEVIAWLQDVRAAGVASIICLLDSGKIREFYEDEDLIGLYAYHGFEVGTLPLEERQQGSLGEEELEQVWELFQNLPKPVLIHCNSGLSRTRLAVEYIARRV